MTGWASTVVSGPDGSLEITVPPGRGTLLIQAPKPDYVYRVVGSREIDEGEPGGRRLYVHAMVRLDLQPNTATHDVRVSLQRDAVVRGRLLDPNDKPPPEALMVSQVSVAGYSAMWSPSFSAIVRDGQFELHGVNPERPVRAYFLDAKSRCGTAAEISAQAADKGPVTVRLRPCGSATARFLDPDGKALVEWPGGLRIVMTPGPTFFSRRRDGNWPQTRTSWPISTARTTGMGQAPTRKDESLSPH